MESSTDEFKMKDLCGVTDSDVGKPTIGVIGTGNFAVALTKCLLMVGYDVIIGSRRPSQRRSTLPLPMAGFELSSVSHCLTECDIIFVAIHSENFKETLGMYEEITRGKVLVDVSNREDISAKQSNAEYLASILPNAIVVKAFNSLSAYSLDELASTGNERLKVFIASDSQSGRNIVSGIAKSLGLYVVDLGRLVFARNMEKQVLKTFPRWRMPLIMAFISFSVWTFVVCYVGYVHKNYGTRQPLILKVFNKPLSMASITMLALTYLPGQIAAIMQIYNGTKHKRFPKFMDTWLKCRKQIGLISYFLAVGHVIISALINVPGYYSWFPKMTVTLPGNTTVMADAVLPVSSTWMSGRGEATLFWGVISFLLLSVVAVTSIPSVAGSLNWSEWNFVQSKLGFVVLLLSLIHTVVQGAERWVGFVEIFKSNAFLSAILPIIVLTLKIILTFTPLSSYLRKIRRGWERHTNAEDDEIMCEKIEMTCNEI